MKCPGQDSRFWKLDAIFEAKCPNCGYMIEFFKDDTKRRCKGCGKDVPNPQMDFGCAAYCPYAEHCLGSLPEGAVGDSKLKALKAKMLRMLKDKFKVDSKKMALTTRFLELAELLGKSEGVNLGGTLLAAFVMGLEEIGEIDHKESQKALEELDAEHRAIEDARNILSSLSSEKELKEGQLLKDALTIAIHEQKNELKILKEKGLLTSAAHEFLRTINH